MIVFQFIRAALAIATHPGVALRAPRGSDVEAARRDEMNAIVQFTLETLRDKSPVGSLHDPHPGLYRESHTLFINGHSVLDLSGWHRGDVIHITNPVPYARKIEIGRVKASVPAHVYELTEQAVQSKYGDIARIEFTTMPVTFSRSGAGPAKSSWLLHQPAISIRELN